MSAEPPARGPDAQPPRADWIDWQRFRTVAADCGWSDAELTRFYADGTRQQLGQLVAVLDAGDARDLERLAHGARGSSETCGLRGMAELFRELERCGENGRLRDGHELIARALRRLVAIERALDDGGGGE